MLTNNGENRRNRMTPSEIIMSRVTRGDILAQLAEECCELAQAALKLRRTIEGTSPTPTTTEEAEENLQEETADVFLTMMYAIGLNESADNRWSEIFKSAEAKEARWAQRLSE